jgi:hypothetical protein
MHLHDRQTLTRADHKRFITYPFELLAGTRRLDVRFGFDPPREQGIANVLSLTLFGPEGWRGASHCCRAAQEISISAEAATPGYLAGALPAGAWMLQVETHGLAPGTSCTYTLDIASQDGIAGDSLPAVVETVPLPARPPRGGPAWYRGDLHTHTLHSDGHVPVAGRVAAAEARDLDFFFLTDHNTVSGLVELDSVSSPRVLPARGMELTTFWGHALCLGGGEWVEWRAEPGTGEMAAIVRAAEAAGRLFIIAHPHAIDDPHCTGCAWHYDDVMPGPARAVEVWNGRWNGDSGNEENLALWYGWLNAGLRIVATCGTDTHGLYPEGEGELRSLEPFSHVYAAELTEDALLDAIRRGRLYLSSGPRLDLHAQAGNAIAGMGDELTLSDAAAEFRCVWTDCPPDAVVRAVVDGAVIHEWRAGSPGQATWQVAPRQGWCTVEIRGADGNMLALSNPVFCRAAR